MKKYKKLYAQLSEVALKNIIKKLYSLPITTKVLCVFLLNFIVKFHSQY